MTCWLPKVPAWFSSLRGIVDAYEKGMLFRPGGIAAQPAWYLPIVQHFIACREEFLAERMKQETQNRAALARAQSRRR